MITSRGCAWCSIIGNVVIPREMEIKDEKNGKSIKCLSCGMKTPLKETKVKSFYELNRSKATKEAIPERKKVKEENDKREK